MDTATEIALFNDLKDSIPGATSHDLSMVIFCHPNLRELACQPFIDSEPTESNFKFALEGAPELQSRLVPPYLAMANLSDVSSHLDECQEPDLCDILAGHLIEKLTSLKSSWLQRVVRRFLGPDTGWNRVFVIIIRKSKLHGREAWQILKLRSPNEYQLRQVMTAVPEFDHETMPMFLALEPDFSDIGLLARDREDLAERFKQLVESCATSVDDYIEFASYNDKLKPFVREWLLANTTTPEAFVQWFTTIYHHDFESVDEQPLWEAFLRTDFTDDHLQQIIQESNNMRDLAAEVALENPDSSNLTLVLIFLMCLHESPRLAAWNRIKHEQETTEYLPTLMIRCYHMSDSVRHEIAEAVLGRCNEEHSDFNDAMIIIVRDFPDLAEMSDFKARRRTKDVLSDLEDLKRQNRLTRRSA